MGGGTSFDQGGGMCFQRKYGKIGVIGNRRESTIPTRHIVAHRPTLPSVSMAATWGEAAPRGCRLLPRYLVKDAFSTTGSHREPSDRSAGP